MLGKYFHLTIGSAGYLRGCLPITPGFTFHGEIESAFHELQAALNLGNFSGRTAEGESQSLTARIARAFFNWASLFAVILNPGFTLVLDRMTVRG